MWIRILFYHVSKKLFPFHSFLFPLEQILNSGQRGELIYNMVMKRFLKLFTSLFVAFSFVFSLAQTSWAEEYRVLVLPDNIDFSSTNHLIYPDASVMFASDTINEIKKDSRVQTVSMTEVRDALRKNVKLSVLTKNALKEYKYNYNIPFVDFRAIAKCFNTDKVLVITSQTDVQNYFLRRTVWDFLNIPGAAVIDPAYKLSTFASLIDVDKEVVLWQGTYYKKLTSVENRMIAVSFAPATEQLEKIKSYSTFFLSPDIAAKVRLTILPPEILNPLDTNLINISNVKPQRETVVQDEVELKSKAYPSRLKPNTYGAAINDL